MSDVQLKITGMTCDHCVRAVSQALKAVPGVSDADVTLTPGGAVVHGQADTAALVAAVKEAGYTAEAQP